MHQLSLERRTGYGYETDIEGALKATELRFHQVIEQTTADSKSEKVISLDELAENARKIIEAQDELGRWVVHQDKFRKEVQGKRWNGEYRTEDRISSALFNHSVETLCQFLEMYKNSTK